MKVLFSRGRNDFEHVYELPSVPRVGEGVGLMDSPYDSVAQQYVVTDVHWTPDHTAYDVSAGLEKAAGEHVTNQDDNPGEVIKEELWRNIERNALSYYPANVADKIMAALTAAGFAVTKAKAT